MSDLFTRQAPRTYLPNHIPPGKRALNAILSIALLAYGGVGIYHNDLFLPAKRGPGIHFHDGLAWVMYGAFVCAALNLASVIADHYDQRNNERNYKIFATTTQICGWILFFAALGFRAFKSGR